jgi:transketolase
MAKNNNIYALVADIGFRNFDKIIEDFPERFINVGIAESNMIGIAAGLTLSGKRVFAFTLAPFITMRCFEQIRIDLCFQNLPVTIVGAGGGLVYGSQGTTHHAIEDVGILRTLPHMNIICPADARETCKAIEACIELDGPVYVRIGRNNEPVVYDKDYNFQVGKSVQMREGTDITILSSGFILKTVLDVANELESEGINTSVINMHTIKPIDKDMIINCVNTAKPIITIEEHNIIGGLGSAVAEVICEQTNRKIPFKRLGLNDQYCRMHAELDDLRQEYGLSKKAIVESVKEIVQKV